MRGHARGGSAEMYDFIGCQYNWYKWYRVTSLSCHVVRVFGSIACRRCCPNAELSISSDTQSELIIIVGKWK